MSAFKVDVIARNPKHEELATQPLSALADIGSELTRLPADLLRGIGITPRRKRVFATVTQQRIEREIGYAILSAEGYDTIDEVVFAEPGDMTLLGVRTIEGFGVMVDNIAHRFVATKHHRSGEHRKRAKFLTPWILFSTIVRNKIELPSLIAPKVTPCLRSDTSMSWFKIGSH